MDFRHHINCNEDFLEISEGEDRHSVIMRYCYTESDPENRLPERFRTIRTYGRYLTMYFHSDERDSARGFSIDWEFSSNSDDSKFKKSSF
jgi:hypothetical protein